MFQAGLTRTGGAAPIKSVMTLFVILVPRTAIAAQNRGQTACLAKKLRPTAALAVMPQTSQMRTGSARGKVSEASINGRFIIESVCE